MAHIPSYPKVYNLGHAAIAELFQDSVVVEEKVDGSQWSFGVYDGELACRSKGKDQLVGGQDKMFDLAVQVCQELAPLLHEGWTYRCEYLSKPKHNTLAYDRVPAKHLILFDVDVGIEDYTPYGTKVREADRLGLECVPLLSEGKFTSFEQFQELLETVSCLGGQKVEGVVIKNYQRFGVDGKALMGKYVSEAYKEVHASDWSKRYPAGKEIRQVIADRLCTEARWRKAVQHFREDGRLLDAPQDIGPLIREIQEDTLEETEEQIKDWLFDWAVGDVRRGVIRGFPEWYKEQLAKAQFGEE